LHIVSYVKTTWIDVYGLSSNGLVGRLLGFENRLFLWFDKLGATLLMDTAARLVSALEAAPQQTHNG
jgi:hypothetical protein